jgi:M6 family metalloprotease-like protein
MSTPFTGKTFTFRNPDGSALEVRGWGDQHYAVFETLDGYTVVKGPGGSYEYAELSGDGRALRPTGARAGDVDPRTLGLPRHARIRRSAAKEQAITARSNAVPRRWEVRRAEKKALARRRARGRVAAPPPGQTVGNYVGLCLLVEFPDVPGTIAQPEVDAYCNQLGYAGYGNNGSVRDYFHDVSGGRLTYTNVVTAYYTAAHPRAHYTDPAIPYGTRARELIVEALDDLVAKGFDFGPLSSDGGGYVYALNVFYAGAVSNNWSEGLWPHSWALASPYVAAPGKKLNDYQITDLGAELSLGTFCHENGHMICDFPDLYDYGYESNGAGSYCLMAFGGSDKNPVQVGPYLKAEAGWARSLTPIVPGVTATIQAGANDLYVHARNDTEYFILENRQRTGRDASLPDEGLAIWHVDELGSNNNEQMTAASHYECAIEQADGRCDIERRANYGDLEDLFGAPDAVRFAHDTVPNSHWWDGSPSGLTIDRVSAPAPTMTFFTGDAPVATRADVVPSLALLLLE